MPYKSGKMKGELTTTEIRKLIRTHNVLVSIKIPKGSKREDIMAIVKKAGYMVDHEKQALRPVSKGKVKKLPVVDMNKATQVLPKPKTKEEKAVAKKSKDMKKKEKEDKIKAEGVKQGAALQRVLAKKKVAPVKKTTPKKNDDDELNSTNVNLKEKLRKKIMSFKNKELQKLLNFNEDALRKIDSEYYGSGNWITLDGLGKTKSKMIEFIGKTTAGFGVGYNDKQMDDLLKLMNNYKTKF